MTNLTAHETQVTNSHYNQVKLIIGRIYSYVHMKPLLGLFMKGNWHFSKWYSGPIRILNQVVQRGTYWFPNFQLLTKC